MKQDNTSSNNLQLIPLRLLLVLTIFLNVAGLYEFIETVDRTKLPHPRIWTIIVALGVSGIVLGVALFLITWTSWKEAINRGLDIITQTLGRLGALNLLLFVVGITCYLYAVFGPYGEQLGGISLRFFLFWVVVLAGSALLKAWGPLHDHCIQGSWNKYLGISLLLATLGYQIATFIPGISTYPYTLGWSETSRYYYASLFFSERIYGFAVPPSVTNPSRYVMQALPFIIPDSPLWLHRMWQVILWLVTTLITAFTLVHRVSIPDRLRRWLLIAWIFTFLLLGPVYYNLQIPVIIVLWGFNRDNIRLPGRRSTKSQATKLRFAQSLGAVILASAWAGISRVNWFPVPGMLAAILYFLEEPTGQPPLAFPDSMGALIKSLVSPKHPIWSYLIKPIVWVLLGTLGAFAAQTLYVLWSGNAAEEFTTHFTSDLLWYRLFPSPTYPPGILPAILLVSLPLFLLIAYRLTERHNDVPNFKCYHPIRLLGLGIILLVLFVGGLVVSTKIGGGSNLHNLDAYMTLLLVTTLYIYFNRAAPDRQMDVSPISFHPGNGEHLSHSANQKLLQSGIAMALIIPAFFTIISSGPPAPLPSQEQITKSLATITRHVETAGKRGGDVLFISNRHMLTFHYFKGVTLIPEYERMFLMEMAMAGNPEYLGKFRDDLKNHRFALIVSEPLYIQHKGSAEMFGEENDAWVQQISRYILNYYKPRKTWPAIDIQLLTPKLKTGR